MRSATRVLPGFGLSLGVTTLWLGLVVLVPLAALLLESASLGWRGFVDAVASPRALASYQLSFGAPLAAAAVNTVFGTVVAWVLVRYSFPGKRVLDALVDLPFALPTAVSGIALAALYSSEGWLGRPLGALGIDAAFTRLGVVIALTFVGLPFVVRTLQPALQELEPEVEEAAANLGATRFQTLRLVILPTLRPALITGFALSFARGLGEYGSVIFISGNMPFRTEITPLLIVMRLEQYDYGGATALAVVMLVASFVVLLGLNVLGRQGSGRWIQAGVAR